MTNRALTGRGQRPTVLIQLSNMKKAAYIPSDQFGAVMASVHCQLASLESLGDEQPGMPVGVYLDDSN